MRRALAALAALALLAAPLPTALRAQEAAPADGPATYSGTPAEEGNDPAQSERDRDFLTRLIEDNLSGAGRQVQIFGFKGALSSRATFERLTVADAEGTWITIEAGAIQWNRAALLRGRVEVEELSAQRIALPRLPGTAADGSTKPEAAPFALPDLPVSVRLGKLAVTEIVLGAPVLGEEITAALSGTLELADGQGKAVFDLARSDGKTGEIRLDTAFTNATSELALDLLVREGKDGIVARKLDLPGRPALTLAAAGTGPLDDFTAKIRLASDGSDRLAGTVALKTDAQSRARAFAVDLSGDFAPLLDEAYRPFFGAQARIAAQGESRPSGQLVIDRLDLATEALKVAGRLDLAPSALPNAFDLAIGIGLAEGAAAPVQDGARAGEVLLPLSGERTWLRKGDIRLAYDRANGDGWRLEGALEGLRRAAGEIGALRLSGSGRIRHDGEGETGGGAAGGSLRLAAEGLALADAALQEALGRRVALETTFSWEDRAPLRLPKIALEGEGYRLGGRLALDNLAEGLLAEGAMRAEYASIARLSGLAGRPLSGAVTADLSGQATLATGAFDAVAHLEGQDLGLALAQVDPLLRGASTIDLSARRDETGITLRALEAETRGLAASASGRIASGASDLSARARLKDLRLIDAGLRGAFDLVATLKEEGDLRRIALDGTTAGFGTANPQLSKVLGGTGTLRLRATEQNGRIAISEGSLAAANLSAAVNGTVDQGRADLGVKARLANVALLAPGFPGPLTLEGKVGGTAERYSVDLGANGPGGTTARIAGSLDAALRALDLDVTGSAQLALANAFIAPRSIEGPVSFDLAVNGPAALSSVSGRVSTSGARLVAPTLSLILENIDARADLSGERAAIDLAARLSTGGTVRISGPVSLAAPNQADLAIVLEALRLRDPELYETFASGRLRLSGPLAGGGMLSGTVDLSQTEVKIPSSGVSGVADIPPIDHVAEPAPVRATRGRAGLLGAQADGGGAGGPGIRLDLTINAPRQIYVRGRGLDAELGGALRLTGTTANVVPVGQFTLLRGRLDILGKRFDLNEGQIALQGALVPWIRFVATSVQDDMTISIVLEGQATAPEITLTSSPELPQEEILARLLFGQDLGSISPLQAAQLASAVATLAGKGGAGIIGNLREKTGLDDIDITTDAEGNTELKIGKYLSENVYSDVSVGSDGESSVNLNLDVTPSLTVRGSVGSDGDSGLGLFYEKDY